ncbi:MAG: dienelactone hydrolase family protein [Christensenellales bacterium]
MAYKFLTPIQVWEGYSPVKEPLEVAIVKTFEEDGIRHTDMYYTVETVKDGKVRGFLRLMAKEELLGKRCPLIAFLPADDSIEEKARKSFLDRGYAVAVIDYAGEAEGKEFFTQYPKSLEYGNLKLAGTRLTKLIESSRDTVWFLWTKVVRRALTVLESQAAVDPSKIVIIGEKLGGQLAWQVAGTDGRVRALVPILGGGYNEYRGKFKYSADNNIEMTEERSCWLAGSAPQAYAQFIACPVYFLSATNSECADFDRAHDILQLVSCDEAVLYATPMANRQISEKGIDCMMVWIAAQIEDGIRVHQPPEASFEVSEGKLYVKAKLSSTSEEIKAYASIGEVDPTGRNWRRMKRPAKTGEGEYLFEAPVYNAEDRIFVFVNALFADGAAVTSKVISCVPKNEMVTAVSKANLEERVIYESSMGDAVFVVETDGMFLESGLISIKEGPMNISGITTSNGRLVTYKLRESKYSKEKTSVLQLHAFSAEKRKIYFNISLFNDETVYTAEAELKSRDKWQRITLNSTDFKSPAMRTLKEWSQVKKLEIANAENVLINNVLWV